MLKVKFPVLSLQRTQRQGRGQPWISSGRKAGPTPTPLMHQEEIRKLMGKTQQKGLTLIPTRRYFKNGKVKVELALAKGKQVWDRRETERRRTADQEAREAIRSRQK